MCWHSSPKLNGAGLIIEKATIDFYKTKIIGSYHRWYKNTHKGRSPKSDFVLLTQQAYCELEPPDRRMCKEVTIVRPKDEPRFYSGDVNRIQQRGRMYAFLQKIGFAENKWYERIDEVYIPPLEYTNILRTLNRNKIVFITGTREYGKTFTAIRLLWDFYNKGFEPRWFTGRTPRERDEIERHLENITSELKPNHIIYFEDPFGKTKYEKRENLEREIGSIIEITRKVENAYVIIKSREEVFKEFQKEKISLEELVKFEETLNVKKPSYNHDKRKDILLKWAEVQECKWFGNSQSRDFILKQIEDETILPTPLSLKDFTIATVNIERINELAAQLGEKSRETARAFADEIRNMTHDKILFLAFLFISQDFTINYVKELYQTSTKMLNIENAWECDRVINWFKNDKINIRCGKLEFAHASYYDTLQYLLIDDGYISWINERIISRLLLYLSERNEVLWETAWFLADNFRRLAPEIAYKLLVKLSNIDEVSDAISWCVAINYDVIPHDIRNGVMVNISEMDQAVYGITQILLDHFNDLADDLRAGLLKKALEYGPTARYAIQELFRNFHDISAAAISEITYRVSENEDAVSNVLSTAREVLFVSDDFPENVSDNLLRILANPIEVDHGGWTSEEYEDSGYDDCLLFAKFMTYLKDYHSRFVEHKDEVQEGPSRKEEEDGDEDDEEEENGDRGRYEEDQVRDNEHDSNYDYEDEED